MSHIGHSLRPQSGSLVLLQLAWTQILPRTVRARDPHFAAAVRPAQSGHHERWEGPDHVHRNLS
jgi:hypothetical protein